MIRVNKRSVLLAISLLTITQSVNADGIFGLWDSEHENPTDDYVRVRIAPCEENEQYICGLIVEAFRNGEGSTEADFVGKRMLWGFEEKTESYWTKGKLWAPDTEKTYASKLDQINDDRLIVSGCVLFFCRDQIWTRAN